MKTELSKKYAKNAYDKEKRKIGEIFIEYQIP